MTASNVEPQERAVRYIIISLLRTIGSTFGHFIGGFIIALDPWFQEEQLFNYSGNFTVSIGLSILAILWAVFFVRDRGIEEDQKENEEKMTVNGNSSAWKTLKRVIDLENLSFSLKTVLKKREGNQRQLMWLMIFVVNLSLLPVFGKSAVIYPLVQKLYKWNAVVYSNLMSFSGLVHILCTVIVTPLLFKIFKPNDCQTVMVGIMAGFLADVFIGSILTPYGFYLHAFISSLITLADTGARAYLSKLIPKNEVSSMFAVTMVMEAVLKSISAYMFAFLLKQTISFYPTFVFHFMCILLIIALVILVFVDLNTEYQTKKR